MAMSPTLPPQAYTREFLTSAFNWLQTQPESVRKAATSPDALVALFRRAQRYGASSLENDAPVSSQNFISDLKNLAEGLKQFDGPEAKPVPAPELAPMARPTPMSATQIPRPPLTMNDRPNERTADRITERTTDRTNAWTHSVPLPMETQIPTAPVSTPTAASAPIAAGSGPVSGLNDRTRQMIQEVKIELNLSSEAEAINMMVSLAYKNLRSLLA